METNTNQVEVIAKKRGRKIDPNCLKSIRLDGDNHPAKKGAPKVGQSYTQVWVHRSVKNSEFVFGVTPVVKTETVTVGPRKPRKTVVVVPVETNAAVETSTPVAASVADVGNVPVIGEGAIEIPA